MFKKDLSFLCSEKFKSLSWSFLHSASCLFEPLGSKVMNWYWYLWTIPPYIGLERIIETAAGWEDSREPFWSLMKALYNHQNMTREGEGLDVAVCVRDWQEYICFVVTVNQDDFTVAFPPLGVVGLQRQTLWSAICYFLWYKSSGGEPQSSAVGWKDEKCTWDSDTWAGFECQKCGA